MLHGPDGCAVVSLKKSCTNAYLPLSAFRYNIVSDLGVCLYCDHAATMVAHGESPYFGGVVTADLLLLRIEADPLCNVLSTLAAPYIEGHLKPVVSKHRSKCCQDHAWQAHTHITLALYRIELQTTSAAYMSNGAYATHIHGPDKM